MQRDIIKTTRTFTHKDSQQIRNVKKKRTDLDIKSRFGIYL